MARFQLLVLVIFSAFSTYGQIGGSRSFEFLNVPDNAVQAALGGRNISLTGKDPNLFYSNPALADTTFASTISLNYLNYFADIQQGSATYTGDFKTLGVMAFGIRYLSTGSIQGFDPAGNPTGDFRASDFMLQATKSHRIDNFQLGGSLKYAFSYIGDYNAGAVLVDLGGLFIHPNGLFTSAIVISNLGFRTSDFTDFKESKLPFDVRAGVTFRPKYMPARFSITAFNLARGDVTVTDADDPAIDEEPGVFDKVFRHMALGMELLISKNVEVNLGYNHQRRKELRLASTSGGAGFSGGFTLRVKAFQLSYGRSTYHVSGASNHITLTGNLGRLFSI